MRCSGEEASINVNVQEKEPPVVIKNRKEMSSVSRVINVLDGDGKVFFFSD